MIVDLAHPIALRVYLVLLVYRLFPHALELLLNVFMGFVLQRRGLRVPSPCDKCVRPAMTCGRWVDRFGPAVMKAWPVLWFDQHVLRIAFWLWPIWYPAFLIAIWRVEMKCADGVHRRGARVRGPAACGLHEYREE